MKPSLTFRFRPEICPVYLPQAEVVEIVGDQLVAQEGRDLLILLQEGALEVGAEEVMAVLDLWIGKSALEDEVDQPVGRRLQRRRIGDGKTWRTGRRCAWGAGRSRAEGREGRGGEGRGGEGVRSERGGRMLAGGSTIGR